MHWAYDADALAHGLVGVADRTQSDGAGRHRLLQLFYCRGLVHNPGCKNHALCSDGPEGGRQQKGPVALLGARYTTVHNACTVPGL
ncbi:MULTISPECIES: hypothetical protein [unclassified Mesorhizobium]|uniref:hypothetical protein n=1 Tax=unclassified Mesorhizobium TaxID=325217 RepID=UPI0013E3E377|nr:MULTISPECIES: hypothetical protein [unclassified Mesorhizobium]